MPDNGYTLIASSKTESFRLPKYLKKKAIAEWTDREKIWLNTYDFNIRY